MFEEENAEDDVPQNMEELKKKMEEKLKTNSLQDQIKKEDENKKDEKEEEDKKEDNEKIPQFEDLLKIIDGNAQKDEKVYKDGNEFNTLQCFFKNIKISKKEDSSNSNFNESYGIFFCNKKNDITKLNCEPGNEICPNCMKNTQKKYGLKPHYLINSKGRVCTYKRGKIYCKGKFSKLEENDINKGIKYSYNYVCGHSGQCDSCKSLTKIMDKYFDAAIMKKLIERDKNMN